MTPSTDLQSHRVHGLAISRTNTGSHTRVSPRLAQEVLPLEVWAKVCCALDFRALVAVQKTSRVMHKAAQEPFQEYVVNATRRPMAPKLSSAAIAKRFARQQQILRNFSDRRFTARILLPNTFKEQGCTRISPTGDYLIVMKMPLQLRFVPLNHLGRTPMDAFEEQDGAFVGYQDVLGDYTWLLRISHPAMTPFWHQQRPAELWDLSVEPPQRKHLPLCPSGPVTFVSSTKRTEWLFLQSAVPSEDRLYSLHGPDPVFAADGMGLPRDCRHLHFDDILGPTMRSNGGESYCLYAPPGAHSPLYWGPAAGPLGLLCIGRANLFGRLGFHEDAFLRAFHEKTYVHDKMSQAAYLSAKRQGQTLISLSHDQSVAIFDDKTRPFIANFAPPQGAISPSASSIEFWTHEHLARF